MRFEVLEVLGVELPRFRVVGFRVLGFGVLGLGVHELHGEEDEAEVARDEEMELALPPGHVVRDVRAEVELGLAGGAVGEGEPLLIR